MREVFGCIFFAQGGSVYNMKKRQIVKLAVTVAVLGAIVYLLMAGFFIGIYKVGPLTEKVPLGLDLTGGVYAVYQSDQGDFSDTDFDSKMDTTVSVLRKRLDDKGYTEATIVRQGTDRIRVEIPINKTSASDNPEDIIAFISDTGLLEFCDINGDTKITGDQVKQAVACVLTDENDTKEYAVRIVFDPAAADTFATMTQESYSTGESLDIKLDGTVISSPVAEGVISEGEAYITNGSTSFTADEVNDLAIKIESGALPLVLEEMQSSTISASLGADALQTSLFAGLIGICVLFVFMIVFYRLPGLMADIALTLYIFLILFVLALFQIQLTLPGIAGIILSVGMAVDANVIIFERFRDELAGGKTLQAAMKAGFNKAMSTIIDSNVTTVIAGAVIAIYGVGTVKGFGYTLIIGIVLSMFTAVVVSRWLMKLALSLNIQNKKLYSRPKKLVEIPVKGVK
jgi:preprotein translocase subunit SecD